MININMELARDIWRNKIRVARTPALAALDIEYQRADETNNAALKADIAQRKQALRDAPADPNITAATTPEELQAIWPSGLSPATS